MIRMFQSTTSAHAKAYFREALSKADYYINDQELNGSFNGRIAKMLGLEGKLVDADTFNKFCDNINPKHGGSLTPRTLKGRRVGYDISFHAPKSVSILNALNDDGVAMEIFKESIHETMLEIEQDMQTRVRVQRQQTDRDTRSLIWTNFIHQTARPVGGHAPDPHLHCHCFTFNVTYDEVEAKFKAGQFHNIKRDMPYYQRRFHKRMADKFAKKGYTLRKTKDCFELAVIPQAAIDLFSKRTNHIGQVAKEKGITDPKKLDELGALTREKKKSTLSMEELQDEYRNALKRAGVDGTTKSEIKTTDRNLTASRTVQHAIDHIFQRNSTKRERQILERAYHYAIDNQDVTLDDIDKALQQDDRIFKIKTGSDTLCTTKLVLQEERRMVQLAVDGVGKRKPFQMTFQSNGSFKDLGEEQQTALKHILTSQDRLTMVRGGAGTGKTTLIKHAVHEIKKSSGKDTVILAPTTDAAHDVLKKEGFEKTNTLARFLVDKDLQKQAKNQVIWVDEFGMVGTKDAVKLQEIAIEQNAPIIASGDPRQHPAVDRGDAMRILNTVAKIPQVSLETIYRQKQENYKSAVFDISKGDVSAGFKKLYKMGSIKEHDYTDIAGTLTEDYLKIRDDKKSALVISPTREQVKKINKAIREGLRKRGIIKKHERTVTVYDDLHFTYAQKQDPRNYTKGDVVQASQNMKGIKRGERLDIDEVKNGKVLLLAQDGKTKFLPLQYPDRFEVYSKRELQLSKGDEMRVTKPCFDVNGKRINNGTVLNIKWMSKKNGITAVKKSKGKTTEFQLNEDFGNWRYAYCSTSHSAQSKTVDHVLINQPSVTFPASNQNQFYVSVSRGREGVTIYTEDKVSLFKQIEKSGDRLGATELVNDMDLRDNFKKQKEIEKKELDKSNDRGYEPEI